MFSPGCLPAGSLAASLRGHRLLAEPLSWTVTASCQAAISHSSHSPLFFLLSFQAQAGSGYQLLLVAFYCTSPGHFPTSCLPFIKSPVLRLFKLPNLNGPAIAGILFKSCPSLTLEM